MFCSAGDLLAWGDHRGFRDVSEHRWALHRHDYVGCRNPTKIQGTRLSLYPVNLEITPNTYAPTINWKAQVTVNNDAVLRGWCIALERRGGVAPRVCVHDRGSHAGEWRGAIE